MPPPHETHEKSSAVDHDVSGTQGESLNGFTLGIGPSRLAQCFASFSAVCSPCITCYASIPAASPYDYTETQPYVDHKPQSSHSLPSTLSPVPPRNFASDGPITAQQMFPNYSILQPDRTMAIQPTTSREGMVYPGLTPSQGYSEQHVLQQPGSPISPTNHIIGVQSFTGPPSARAEGPRVEGPRRHYRGTPAYTHIEIDRNQMQAQTRELDFVASSQKASPARRGPFRNQGDRERTAETRRIGSCIRCRMQRIRCETNPEDRMGTCLTCSKVSNVKVWRMPCLRYKITDVRLFKPGPVKGHEWTRRWVEGSLDDISHWASTETRRVRVSEGYTKDTVELRVRQFVPQEGDSLERTWVHDGVRKRVRIPAYAIVNLGEARDAYSTYINNSFVECCKRVLFGKDKLLLATYGAALRVTRDPTATDKEKELLNKALQLWMAVRMTTKSTVIVGEETLGMSPDIMDETSSLRGKIPLPPVMGAQIELVLIHQIQSSLRREMLENLQSITTANKQQTWFTTYLITFILLHNVALLCQHDASYARKHGMKVCKGGHGQGIPIGCKHPPGIFPLLQQRHTPILRRL
ncbi:hypothetical protein NPX13_g11272 [Xylaria arbuscula]|uniref:Zn(2)-C6 fungal-type domain-containing protein n=1 Tax=Xylaria arbuscula TaxID=114810 RepID=A0A9W8TFS7_9PEZI|nr:hypothetical protein NPX13_g11272 [Xylaria arbuscula]